MSDQFLVWANSRESKGLSLGHAFDMQISPSQSQTIVAESLSSVPLFVIPWTAACQDFLSIISWSLLKLISIKSVMPSNYLILCRPLLFPSSIFLSIRVFSNESALRIRWPKYWSFSFSISPSNEYSGWFPLGLTGLILLSKELSRVFSNTRGQKHQFFGSQLSS